MRCHFENIQPYFNALQIIRDASPEFEPGRIVVCHESPLHQLTEKVTIVLLLFYYLAHIILGKAVQKVFAAAKRLGSTWVTIGDGSKHASLVSAVGADQHICTNAYLLKGKYSQIQILEPPFSAGVTVERLRDLLV